MLLEEKDHAVFKSWLLPNVENISGVEGGVLADYVAALVTVDDTDANVQRTLIESLQDFLGPENTEPFAKDVIAALKAKSYLPKPKANDVKPQASSQASQSAPIQSIVGSTNFEYEPHPSNVPFGAPKGPAANRNSAASHLLPDRPTAQGLYQDGSNQSRKRKVLERDNSQSQEGQDPHYTRSGAGNNRPSKQTARRGGRNAGTGDARTQNAFASFGGMPNFTNLPPPPPGPLPFDTSDPMAFFAMAAAFGANLPGMPQLPFSNTQDGGSSQGQPKTKCADYYERGFCALGSLCPHEHSDAAVAVSPDEIPEYDPEQSFLAVQPSRGSNKQGVSGGQPRATKGRRARASFSLPGYSRDKSNRTLVVEQIPAEHFNEDSIRSYFSEFGDIDELELHSRRQLAVIKFADRQTARRAYHSPKAVFENRFVKVYWYAPETKEKLAQEKQEDEEEKLDLEAIAIRQAEAQKAFEERRRKAAEADARAADIERQLEEKNKEIEEIKRQLAELSGDPNDDFAQTLATLQAEAAELFDQHGPGEQETHGRGAFNPAYRGRGYAPFAPRGRGFGPYRGAYRGRAGGYAGRGVVNKKLDNRPRRLAVTQIQPDTPRDESLRQHLLNIPECTNIERHPEQADTLILTFKERYQAETFLDQSLNIPDVGKLDLAWVPNDAFGGLKSVTTTDDAPTALHDDDGDDSSATIGEQEIKVEEDEDRQMGGVDADMDVADDVDEWL
ncbi:uncharacterized protein J4E78_009876 [Alternaria triticimaculans]|uniref:uncharacterized protein n=1 Tax=Alternaria triticimaculans TaxID=297637 RepID=UPI0020C4B239|nr:uncharacterized protein J4E78_009876 [Alternaria triticimaculans]KAI4643407.1 hypothetical protein J4E78_009876 [Alternaria triticimaculans]